MNAVDYKQTGTVFDLQRFSINDGPGIRTIVFLKGCDLRCAWCSNPESQKYEPELLFRSVFCIHCLQCVDACNYDAIGPKYENWVDRKKCTNCGDCVMVCPSSALIIKGKSMTVEEVIKVAKKDDSYYRNSGGGLTLSGGEALLQPDFSRELLKAAHAQGWNTAMETEGYVDEEVIRDVIPHVDYVLFDIKSIDPKKHRAYTGVDNELILKNAVIVQEITNMIVRVPVIPNFNSKVEEIQAIAEFVATKLPNVKELHILPYHNYGESKYEALGRKYPLHGVKKFEPEVVKGLKDIVESYGLECHVGG